MISRRRPYQTIDLQQGSVETESVVTSTEYDQVGRPIKSYEAVGVTDLDGTSTPLTTANFDQAVYPYSVHTISGVTNNYTLTEYEKSPLNRVVKTTMPGWNNSKIYEYGGVDTSSDAVLKDPQIADVFWGDNDLYKTTVIDENGHKDVSFSDKLGRTLLTRRESQDGTERSDTYHTYDDKHRLTDVYPPGTTPYVAANHSNLIYGYSYYGNDLVKTKKLPDQMGVHEYVYNERDLLRFKQDPKMRAESRWLITMYDEYGREELQGFYNRSTLSSNDISTPDVAFFDFKKLNIYGSGTNIDKLVNVYDVSLQMNFWNSFDDKGRLSYLGRGNWGNLHYVNSSSGVLSADKIDFSTLGSPSFFSINVEVERFTGIFFNNFFGYDSADNIISSSIDLYHYPRFSKAIFSTEIDFANRIKSEEILIDDGIRNLDQSGTVVPIQGPIYTHQLSAYTYTPKGEVAAMNLGNHTSPLEMLTYDYLPNGFLSEIGDVTDASKMFSMTLDYENPSLTGINKLGNGNIYENTWRHSINGSEGSDYTYDFLDRLTASVHTFGHSTTYIYDDLRGNFDIITRKVGHIEIDDLNFTYGDKGNKVLRISDTPLFNEPGVGYDIQGSGDYDYDHNGNMTIDPSRDATITYDHNNLPTKIVTPDGSIDYTYTFDGQLISKKVTEGGVITSEKTYFENIEIKDEEIDRIHHSHGYLKRGDYCNTATTLTLTGVQVENKQYTAEEIRSSRKMTTADSIRYTGKDRITLTEGFSATGDKNFSAMIGAVNCVELENSFVPHYYINDHLGNVRAEFKEEADANGNNVSAVLLGEYNYYPFGGSIPTGTDHSENQYLYNGKERQEELGLRYYNYDTRYYDPTIGRFLSVDIASDLYPAWSPYNYSHNNPVLYRDFMGMGPESIHKDKNGNVIAEIDDGDNNVYVHNDLDMDSGQHIDGTLSQLSQKREMNGTSGGGEKDSWGSFVNNVSKMFEEGDQQQHSGENWFIYGKGSKNGWSINAPKPDPDGTNKSIDIGDMLTPGRFKGPGKIGDFINNVDALGDRLSGQSNLPMNDTIYKCSDCSGSYRDSSGIMIPTNPNAQKPQGSIRYTRHN